MSRMRCAFTVKAAGDKAQMGDIAGLGAAFNNVDQGGDVCVKGCFARSLEQYKTRGELPAMRWEHKWTEPVGDWFKAVEIDAGLDVEGKLWVDGKLPPTEATVSAYRVANSTGPKGMSIGYRAVAWDIQNNVRYLREVELYEISIVSFPMNTDAVITSAKSAGLLDADGKLVDIRTAEHVLRETLGLNAKQAKAFLAGGYKAVCERERDVPPTTGAPSADLLSIINQLKKDLQS
jgi:HK97 family phage prohead protease